MNPKTFSILILMMKEILILSNILPRIPPGLHPQVSQYHSLTITSLTNRESTPRPKTFVKYDPEFVFKSKTVLTNKQEHPNRSCLLKSVKREPENVSLQGTVFRLPKTVKRILLKSSLSQGNALSDDIAATTDPKVTVTVNTISWCYNIHLLIWRGGKTASKLEEESLGERYIFLYPSFSFGLESC